MQGVLYEGVWEPIAQQRGPLRPAPTEHPDRGRVAVQVDARRSRQRTRTPPWGSTSLRGAPLLIGAVVTPGALEVDAMG